MYTKFDEKTNLIIAQFCQKCNFFAYFFIRFHCNNGITSWLFESLENNLFLKLHGRLSKCYFAFKYFSYHHGTQWARFRKKVIFREGLNQPLLNFFSKKASPNVPLFCGAKKKIQKAPLILAFEVIMQPLVHPLFNNHCTFFIFSPLCGRLFLFQNKRGSGYDS